MCRSISSAISISFHSAAGNPLFPAPAGHLLPGLAYGAKRVQVRQ